MGVDQHFSIIENMRSDGLVFFPEIRKRTHRNVGNIVFFNSSNRTIRGTTDHCFTTKYFLIFSLNGAVSALLSWKLWKEQFYAVSIYFHRIFNENL